MKNKEGPAAEPPETVITNKKQIKMNGLIYIEKAKVLKLGEFATGKKLNGEEWASVPVLVEWESQVNGANGTQVVKQSSVVVFRQQNAVWARDNVKEGSEFNGVPFMFLNLWVRLWGKFESVRRSDGTEWIKETNSLTVEGAEIAQDNGQQTMANGQQPQGGQYNGFGR